MGIIAHALMFHRKIISKTKTLHAKGDNYNCFFLLFQREITTLCLFFIFFSSSLFQRELILLNLSVLKIEQVWQCIDILWHEAYITGTTDIYFIKLFSLPECHWSYYYYYCWHWAWDYFPWFWCCSSFDLWY
jgi:hypothetical protein